MTIPEIRQRLHAMANEYNLPELHQLAEETRRHNNGRRAPRTLAPLTDREIASIRNEKEFNPDIPLLELAIRYGTNQGRVSEALYGKRL